MREYTVYKHDHASNMSVNFERGYHVVLSSTEGFRDLPITSLIWSESVTAKNKAAAIQTAKYQRLARDGRIKA